MAVCTADYRRDCEEGRNWAKKREELVKECENMKKHYENAVRERDQVGWLFLLSSEFPYCPVCPV